MISAAEGVRRTESPLLPDHASRDLFPRGPVGAVKQQDRIKPAFPSDGAIDVAEIVRPQDEDGSPSVVQVLQLREHAGGGEGQDCPSPCVPAQAAVPEQFIALVEEHDDMVELPQVRE